jgi:hypothetical protein
LGAIAKRIIAAMEGKKSFKEAMADGDQLRSQEDQTAFLAEDD